MSGYALFMAIRKTIYCVDVRWKDCTYMSPPIAVVITLILCFEALLFLLFTAIMFCTQIHSISVDETGIEQLKGEKENVFSDSFYYYLALKTFDNFVCFPPKFRFLKISLHVFDWSILNFVF